MKMNCTILIVVTALMLLIGLMMHKAMKAGLHNIQKQQQKMIEQNPDIAKFYR